MLGTDFPRGALPISTRRSRRRRLRIPIFFIFDSLPGAGAVMAPRLLAAFGSQRERYGSAGEVQTYTGIAPVMEKSGKKKWVHFRWACPKFLCQSFHEWAGHSIAQSVWARSYYQQLRNRGKGHHAAVRALVFKGIRILFRCWKDRVAYDENKYLAAPRPTWFSPSYRQGRHCRERPMNILWIQSGKIVEVDQKRLKTYLTALLRCLAPSVPQPASIIIGVRAPLVRPPFVCTSARRTSYVAHHAPHELPYPHPLRATMVGPPRSASPHPLRPPSHIDVGTCMMLVFRTSREISLL
jgi:hypothetical protein